jgi:hypothetical protein
MLWLIKADPASTGKPNLRDGAPSCFLNVRALNALLRERSHLGLQIVAHEIEFVGTVLIGRVKCSFRWRQGEDQPAMTSIHGCESEDIAKKCSVRFGVLAVDNYVRTRDHLLLLKVGSEFLAGYAELNPFGRHA